MDHVSLLLVDDEQAILHMLKTVLLKEQFLDIDTVTTGEAALEACSNKTYHCIVLDIMLPGRSGLEICPFLRQITDAPILFLTAKTTDYDKLTGFAVGGDDYVVKPFNPLEVVARIKSLLNRYLPSKATAFQQQQQSISSHVNTSSTDLSQGVYDFGRFQVFELAGELRVQGQTVTCPALVFQLLLFSANIRTVSSPSLNCMNACGAQKRLATTTRLWCTSIAFGNALKQTHPIRLFLLMCAVWGTN